MKILTYTIVIFVLFCGILAPVNSTANEFSIPTQWKALKAHAYGNITPIGNIQPQTEDSRDTVTGGAARFASNTPPGKIISIVTVNTFYLVVIPDCENTFVRFVGRKIGSAVFGTPLHCIEKTFKHISTAVHAEISNSGILRKYFQS